MPRPRRRRLPALTRSSVSSVGHNRPTTEQRRKQRSLTRSSVDSGGLDTPRRRYHAPNWVSSGASLSGDIPAYTPHEDPYNPRAIARLAATVPAALGTAPEALPNATLRRRYREVGEFLAARRQPKPKGLRVTMQMSGKVRPETERGVLELVLAREAYIEDLRRFLPTFDAGSEVQQEHLALLKDMVRELGLQVVEAVQEWRAAQGVSAAVTDTAAVGRDIPPAHSAPPPFMFQTENYLCRMANDLAFLSPRNPFLQDAPMHERTWTPREPNALLRAAPAKDKDPENVVLRHRIDSAERLILREEDYVEAARRAAEAERAFRAYKDPVELPLLDPHAAALEDLSVGGASSLPESSVESESEDDDDGPVGTQQRTRRGPHAGDWRVPPMHELSLADREQRMMDDIVRTRRALGRHEEELELRKEKLRAAVQRLSVYKKDSEGLSRRERKRRNTVQRTVNQRARTVERLTIELRQRQVELTRKEERLEDTRRQMARRQRARGRAKRRRVHTRAAVRIQTAWRRCNARRNVGALRSAFADAATRIQAIVRVAVARRELRRRKERVEQKRVAAVAAGIVQLVDLTCAQVQRVLVANGLGRRLAAQFAELRIDGRMLAEAEPEDLDEIGVGARDAKRLTHLVERLQREGVDVCATVRLARQRSERFVHVVGGVYVVFCLRQPGLVDAYRLTPFGLLGRGLSVPSSGGGAGAGSGRALETEQLCAAERIKKAAMMTEGGQLVLSWVG